MVLGVPPPPPHRYVQTCSRGPRKTGIPHAWKRAVFIRQKWLLVLKKIHLYHLLRLYLDLLSWYDTDQQLIFSYTFSVFFTKELHCSILYQCSQTSWHQAMCVSDMLEMNKRYRFTDVIPMTENDRFCISCSYFVQAKEICTKNIYIGSSSFLFLFDAHLEFGVTVLKCASWIFKQHLTLALDFSFIWKYHASVILTQISNRNYVVSKKR